MLRYSWRFKPGRIPNSVAMKINLSSIASSISKTSMQPEICLIPQRRDIVHRLKTEREFDVLVIGGGATGAGGNWKYD